MVAGVAVRGELVVAAGGLAVLAVWGASGLDAGFIREVLGRMRMALVAWARVLTDACVAAVARSPFGRIADKEGSVGLAEIAEMVDIVRLGLSAGLSFDAALGLYCEGKEGRLSEELARARMSWQVGASSRRDALMAVARAAASQELESFAVAVTQALELGAPLAGTLERQGAEMRAAYTAGVEREIERAPVKLLIPTGVLILPALLISIVGPLLAAGGAM